MSELKKESYAITSPKYQEKIAAIEDEKERKIKQYAGEGTTFLLVILAGAIFVYWAVRRQLKISQEQQNFMMAVTHELKTPIAIAKLNLETIQKRKLDEDQHQRLINNTLQETNRLNALCNNLLISSQIEAGGYRMEKQELDLSELLNSCVDDFTSRFPGRIFVNTSPGIIVKADPVLIQICINNLLDNALKYSPKETEVMAALSTSGGQAVLQVTDNGPGIDDKEKDKVFEKFYRLGNEATKRAKGTGLGLYLTRKILRRHRGSIRILNNPGGGSIFAVQLPAA